MEYLNQILIIENMSNRHLIFKNFKATSQIIHMVLEITEYLRKMSKLIIAIFVEDHVIVLSFKNQ